MPGWNLRLSVAASLIILLAACGSPGIEMEEIQLNADNLDSIYEVDSDNTYDLVEHYRQLCRSSSESTSSEKCLDGLAPGLVSGHEAVFRSTDAADRAFRNVRSTLMAYDSKSTADAAYERFAEPTTASVNSELAIDGPTVAKRSIVFHATGRDETGYFNAFRIVLQSDRIVAGVEVSGSAPADRVQLEESRRHDFVMGLARVLERRLPEPP